MIRIFLLLSFIAMVLGCHGDLTTYNNPTDRNSTNDPEISDPRDPEEVPVTGENLCADASRTVGPRLIRRLTKPELETSIRVVFQLDETAWAGPSVPPDPAAQSGFTNDANRLRVTESYAAGLLETAKAVGAAVSAPTHLNTILPCAPNADRACAETFVTRYGRLIFRRAVSPDELDRHMSLFDKVTATEAFPTWVKWATVALIQSPFSVYRSEIGEPDGETFRLTGYEIATQLSFSLTGNPPTEALLDSAERGELDSEEGVRTTAMSLAFDDLGAPRPAFQTTFHRFVNQYLGLVLLPNVTKNPEQYPGFSEEVSAAMAAETELFLDFVAFQERGSLTTLLTEPTTFVSPVLAAHYGFGSNGQIERPPGYGVGILAQGSVMAVSGQYASTSPTKRGVMILKKFLCEEPPPPPDDIPELPEPSVANTTRERVEDLHAAGSCASCHAIFDPIGFAFEHLDSDGRYRENENGFPIDATGLIRPRTDLAFDGAEELAVMLSDMDEVSECFAAQVASFTYGLSHESTTCLSEPERDALLAGDPFVETFVNAVTAPHVLRRQD